VLLRDGAAAALEVNPSSRYQASRHGTSPGASAGVVAGESEAAIDWSLTDEVWSSRYQASRHGESRDLTSAAIGGVSGPVIDWAATGPACGPRAEATIGRRRAIL
jgi:hypothetical protein